MSTDSTARSLLVFPSFTLSFSIVCLWVPIWLFGQHCSHRYTYKYFVWRVWLKCVSIAFLLYFRKVFWCIFDSFLIHLNVISQRDLVVFILCSAPSLKSKWSYCLFPFCYYFIVIHDINFEYFRIEGSAAKNEIAQIVYDRPLLMNFRASKKECILTRGKNSNDEETNESRARLTIKFIFPVYLLRNSYLWWLCLILWSSVKFFHRVFFFFLRALQLFLYLTFYLCYW